MSDVFAPYHVVFSTYRRQLTINSANSEALYRYMWDILKCRGCRLYRINGMPDHVHLLLELNPSVALASLVGELKRSSSLWMKRSGLFPAFEGWGKEYYAHTLGIEGLDRVKSYIINQREHHRVRSFREELDELFASCGIVPRERD
jgi:REP element-mobilizing transposase RayT